MTVEMLTQSDQREGNSREEDDLIQRAKLTGPATVLATAVKTSTLAVRLEGLPLHFNLPLCLCLDIKMETRQPRV